MNVKPSDILYSQDSICNYFDKRCRHSNKLIGETLDDICTGRCDIWDIPQISVKEIDGKWVSADNRRLWVFRQFERLGKCDTIRVRKTYYIPDDKMTSGNGGDTIRVRGKPGGVWYLKQSRNNSVVSSATKASKSNPKYAYAQPEHQSPPLYIQPERQPRPRYVQPGRRSHSFGVQPGRRSPSFGVQPGRRSHSFGVQPGRRSPSIGVQPGRRSPSIGVQPGRRSSPILAQPGRRSAPTVDTMPGKRSPPAYAQSGRRSPPSRSPLQQINVQQTNIISAVSVQHQLSPTTQQKPDNLFVSNSQPVFNHKPNDTYIHLTTCLQQEEKEPFIKPQRVSKAETISGRSSVNSAPQSICKAAQREYSDEIYKQNQHYSTPVQTRTTARYREYDEKNTSSCLCCCLQ